MKRATWVLLLGAAMVAVVAVRRRQPGSPSTAGAPADVRTSNDAWPTPPTPPTPLVVPPSPAVRSDEAEPPEETPVPSNELPDRRRLVKDLAGHLESRRLVTALRIDLDDFDAFARQYGAARTDEVVYATGAAVRGAVRPADKVYRYGPTSFCALLVSTTVSEAETVGARVRDAVRALDVGPHGPVTVSVGIAEGVFSAVAVTLDLAESAVTQARRAGPDGMAVAT
jgi:diguanylate cyclase (GGDEF)-like protein